MAIPPAATISPATASTPSASRSVTATRAPSSAKRCAIARPMPLAAPVTSTTLPRDAATSTRQTRHGRPTYPVMSDPFRGDPRPLGLGFWPLRRGRPGRRHPARAGAHRHRRRRARARPALDAARRAAVAHRGRAHASARRLLRALRVPAARGGGLRGARVRDALPQQRHRLPARARARATSPPPSSGCAGAAPTRSCCSATAAAVR